MVGSGVGGAVGVQLILKSDNDKLYISLGGMSKIKRHLAVQTNTEIFEHYELLYSMDALLKGKEFWYEYDIRTEKLATKYPEYRKVFDFINNMEPQGHTGHDTCLAIHELIQNDTADIIAGFQGRTGVTRYSDFKRFIENCAKNGTGFEWNSTAKEGSYEC